VSVHITLTQHNITITILVPQHYQYHVINIFELLVTHFEYNIRSTALHFACVKYKYDIIKNSITKLYNRAYEYVYGLQFIDKEAQLIVPQIRER